MNLDTQDTQLSSNGDRERLLEQVASEVTEFQDAVNAVDQAVADHLGINRTDLACLLVLLQRGPMTAGAIAQACALTSGSVTAVLDRMERAGYLRRTTDPSDRRRVLAEPTPLAVQRAGLLYGPIDQAGRAYMEKYSPGQLQTISDFLRLGKQLQAEQAARIRAELIEAQAGAPLSAPLGAVAAGRLVFPAGASRVTLAVDPGMPDLFRVRIDGPPPRVESKDGTVTIRYHRLSLLNLGRQQAAEVTLNGSIPWAIEVRGGLANLTGELGSLQLASLDISGGVNKMTLSLSAPSERVPISITGGANHASFLRPAGVGARLTVRGGVARLEVDGHRVDPSTGAGQYDCPAAAGQGSYDIEIKGGASKVRLEVLPA